MFVRYSPCRKCQWIITNAINQVYGFIAVKYSLAQLSYRHKSYEGIKYKQKISLKWQCCFYKCESQVYQWHVFAFLSYLFSVRHGPTLYPLIAKKKYMKWLNELAAKLINQTAYNNFLPIDYKAFNKFTTLKCQTLLLFEGRKSEEQ